jgi:hypothetical protein
MSASGPALFPISLSNQDFSTDVVLPLLADLFARHSQITFLVADHLQIYNKALRLSEGVTLGEIIEDFATSRRYLDQRRRWVSRTIHNLGLAVEDDRWRVLGVDDVADADGFRIFRNVMLAYYAVPAFRRDVEAAAGAHADVRQDIYPINQRRALSQGYILEEIAVSVRLHVVGGIHEEYYIGAQAPVVLGVYDGRYGFDAATLAERPEKAGTDRFYALDDGPDGPAWSLVNAPRPASAAS